MAFSKTNKPAPDPGNFVADTLRKTVSASKPRIIIFVIVLILQFCTIPLFTGLLGFFYPDTYKGMKEKMSDEALPVAFIELVKYLLLIVLIIKSPAERTARRRFEKYALLLVSLYIWLNVDVMSWVFESSGVKSELAKRSFIENSITIYGKVVFASYSRSESVPGRKMTVSVAEKLSPKTNGYMIIVHMNRSAYLYDVLASLCHSFNFYAQNANEWVPEILIKTNIEEKVPDLANCLRFSVNFMVEPESIPELPVPGKYVKIMYDPIEKGIEMYTDAATWVTPSFDSIPGLHRGRSNHFIYK